MRLFVEYKTSSTDDQRSAGRRNRSPLSKDDMKRLSYQMVLGHSRESLLFRLQRQPALRKSLMLARSKIRTRRASGTPSLISNQRVSIIFPHKQSEQPSGRIHRRTTSLSEPIARMRSVYASQARRYVSEPVIEKEAAQDNLKGCRASANATNRDWELELIEGLMFEDLDLDLDFEYDLVRPSKICPKGEQTTSYSATPAKLTIEKLPVKQVLKAIRAEPDIVEIESPQIALQVHQVDMPPTLKIVQAVAVTEQIFDEISPVSHQDLNKCTGNEPVSPISVGSTKDEPVSPISIDFTSTEPASLESTEAIPEIKLDANDWPLPRAALYQESTSQIEVLSSAGLNVHSHPHPLRSNPTHRVITHSSQPTPPIASAAPEIHKKQSTSSLRSNRKAFIMQSNDSSLSLHSQDTVTDMSKNSSWLTPPTPTPPVRDNRRFSGILNLNLKRANAVRHPLPFHRRADPNVDTDTDTNVPQTHHAQSQRPHLRHPSSLAVLTPVSETFEKLSMRRDSADTRTSARPSVSTSMSTSADGRRPSSFSIVAGVVGGEARLKKKKKSKMGGFNGAMVGHSRRGGL